jgi:hypothetical protein
MLDHFGRQYRGGRRWVRTGIVTVVSDVECVVVGVEENIEPGIRLCVVVRQVWKPR